MTAGEDSATRNGDGTTRPGQPATLRTIADIAGVHVATVSRVLNPPRGGEVRSAGAATADRIRRIAADLGYVADPHGRGLRTSRSRLVGVQVPQLADLVLATIYEGIDEAAGDAGYSTFVTNTRDRVDDRLARSEMLLARRVDGVILGDAPIDGSSLVPLRERRVPHVLVSRRVPGQPSVTCDDRAGGRLAAEHLLALGHRRVAVAAGQPFTSTGLDRTQGFREVFAQAGHPIPDGLVRHSPFDVAGGRQAAEWLLAGAPRPTAVFAVNDFAAIGVMGVVRDLGLRPGIDVSIVGFNDVPLAAELPVALTTVASPMREMGRQGFRLLLDIIEGRIGADDSPAPSVALHPELRARASTGSVPPPGD